MRTMGGTTTIHPAAQDIHACTLALSFLLEKICLKTSPLRHSLRSGLQVGGGFDWTCPVVGGPDETTAHLQGIVTYRGGMTLMDVSIIVIDTIQNLVLSYLLPHVSFPRL